MMSLKKISAAIATGAVFLGTMATGAYASSITISGNGAFSDNFVDFESEHSTTVVQSNTSDITNNVSVSNNTGNNSSSFNTGGDTTIRTGDATSEVTIVNEGNTNVASISDCNCEDSTHISISGNGAFSDNSVSVDKSHESVVVQENDTDIHNNVDINNNTGNNNGGSHSNYPDNSHDYDKDYDKHNYDKDHHGYMSKSGFDYSKDNNHYGKFMDNKPHFKFVKRTQYMNDWWEKFFEHRKDQSKKFDNFHMMFGKFHNLHSGNFGKHPSNFYGGNFGHFGGGFNTGGDTSITTGDAHSEVTIHNEGSTNILH